MPTMFDPGRDGRRPVRDATSTSRATVTHGHLPENDEHGGGRLSGLARPARAARAAVGTAARVAIQGFVYGQGDLLERGRRGKPGARAPRAAG